LWDENYKNRVTIKDSVRDTYIIGVCYVYKDELDELADRYQPNPECIKQQLTEYSEAVTEIINRRDDETLAKVEEALKALKKNIAGFEVDSGKNDIRTGKIDINFAWSGDAIYSIQTAWEESELELKYQIPDEGSNIWFDAWVMPKGANKELAHEFLNYLCDPEVAARNMEFIGYTSAIAGDAMLDLVNDWYGVEDGDLAVDLSYFFAGTVSEGKSMIIETDSDNYNLLLAQYPTKNIIARCGIMEDFGDQNEKLLAMWQRVKANIVPVWIYFVAGGIAVGIVSVIVINRQSKQMRIKRQKAKVGKK
jgi:spermidine/putrescine transport system substrate-binding protein